MFSFIRNLQPVSWRGVCTIFHSHQQCKSPIVAPHSCQHLLLCFGLQAFNKYEWYLIDFKFCISLMTYDFQHLGIMFTCHLSSSEFVQIFYPFLNVLSYCFLCTDSSFLVFCKYFLTDYGLLSHYLHSNFHRAKIFNFNKIEFTIPPHGFCFWCHYTPC